MVVTSACAGQRPAYMRVLGSMAVAAFPVPELTEQDYEQAA